MFQTLFGISRIRGNTRSAILVKTKEVSTHSSVDGDVSSESEISAGNPELEMTATESVVRVDLELRAPVSTISENNNENIGKPSSKKEL